MSVGIVGNYGNNNSGDEAILEGILIQLKEVYNIEREEITVFSNQPELMSEKYGVKSAKLYYKNKNALLTAATTISKNKSIIRDLDLLIIGGGGIYMDLYGREAFIFGMYGWLAKLSKTPVVLYGVGAGPILTQIGKVILRSLAHLSKLVTVRDPKSKELMRSIGVKSEIYEIGDPAFRLNVPKDVKKSNKGLQVGVTAVPYHHISYWPTEDKEKYQNYIKGMANNLDNLLTKYPDAQINFFATKHPQDSMVTEEIQKLMTYKERTKVNNNDLNHNEIVEFEGKQDLIIGTRLHSLILALVTNTPIIAVSYHHKVNDFMEMIGCSDKNILIEQLNDNPNFFYETYKNMESNWEDTIKQFEDISSIMKAKAIKGMELIEQTVGADSFGKNSRT